jgi:hypothetical protein
MRYFTRCSPGWLREEQGMKTFEELKATFTQELLELERLTGIWPSTIEKRHVKEQAIGRLCYLAEEDLSPLELGTLKRALGINDTRWRAYKAKFIEGSSPEELA